jgi:predicted amidohydrolase
MKLKIGLIQMLSEKGAVAENLRAICRVIEQADAKDIDILALPEASITGYNDPAKFSKAILKTDGPEIASFLEMTQGQKPVVLAGLIEHNPEGNPFLSQIAAHDGKITGLYRKRRLGGPPDTLRFSRGRKNTVLTCRGVKYGMAICADIGGENIFRDYAREGAQIVFEMAAPGLYGEQATRNWESGYQWWEGVCLKRFTKYAKEYGLWVAVATAAGRTSDEDFPGGAYLFNPQGERVYTTKDWNPCKTYLEIDIQTGAIREV